MPIIYKGYEITTNSNDLLSPEYSSKVYKGNALLYISQQSPTKILAQFQAKKWIDEHIK